MPSPFAPRPLAGRTDEELRNYDNLCLRTLQECLAKHEGARAELARLSKGARRNRIKVFGGVVIFGLGLATTAIAGPLGIALAIGSGALELDGVAGVWKNTRGSARLRGDISDLEVAIAFWRTEQARVFNERRRRAGQD